MKLSIGDVAKICHETNKAYCECIGDYSQKSWQDAEPWQRDSAWKGVEFKVNNPNASNSAQHDSWLDEKRKTGWKYGPVKNPELKEHPCFVPYKDLPEEQKAKDALFGNIVLALKHLIK